LKLDSAARSFSMCPHGDIDFYEVNLPKPGTYNIIVKGKTLSNSYWILVYLLFVNEAPLELSGMVMIVRDERNVELQ